MYDTYHYLLYNGCTSIITCCIQLDDSADYCLDTAVSINSKDRAEMMNLFATIKKGSTAESDY